MNLPELCIRRPVMTTLLMAAFVIFGLIAYRALPVSELPSVDFPTIQVTANLPGASPETMAAAVATPLEGQFSKGCPGDCDGDSLLTREGPVPNLPLVGEKHFPVQAKIALYPMGIPDYIDKIAGVWRMAEKARLNPVSIHYATRISGDVHEVFDYLEAVCRKMEAEVPHYILCFTLSVNSPTQE